MREKGILERTEGSFGLDAKFARLYEELTWFLILAESWGRGGFLERSLFAWPRKRLVVGREGGQLWLWMCFHWVVGLA